MLQCMNWFNEKHETNQHSLRLIEISMNLNILKLSKGKVTFHHLKFEKKKANKTVIAVIVVVAYISDT